MDPHSWQRLEAVFFGALEVPDAERAAWLDRECAGDAGLRAEVEAVLAAHTGTGPDGPAAAVPPTTPEADGGCADTLTGTRIGGWVLDECVGRGGMGVVYRAHRADEQYRREVAIKLVRAGIGAAELVRRFRVERQILANLQHPGIATLLEGGVSDDGQPYLVMPFVRGLPITTYAQSRKLGIPDRLRLFRAVCDAVQYAHANLVVHRDLKPSNILVTDDGDVRLLDFGIAKLLAPGDAGVTAVLTTDSFLLTPEHAAPEQLLRKPVTTATDVYALGVLLYELLTGTRPFRAATQPELYHAICETEPSRPSTALAHASGADGGTGTPRQLRGDLDDIVLMALRKDPARRYASAGQFAEDVSRYLEGQPVLARPDAVGYRLRRFVGRNRVSVTLAALAGVALVAGLIGTSSQARRAQSEARQAAAERDRAERVSALLVDVFRIADPRTTGGQTVAARDVLARGAERILTDLAEQPDAQADLLTEVGRIYENLGLYDDASGHHERALTLRRALYGAAHPTAAESLIRLALVRTEQQRAGEAIEFARAAVAILEGGGNTRHGALADAWLALGGALRAASLPAEAAEAYTAALSLLEAQPQPDHTRAAAAMFGRADAAHEQRQFDLADSLLQGSIARFARAGGAPHADAATSMHALGMLRLFRRRPGDAEPLLRQALDARRRIFGSTHPAVAETLAGLAHALTLLGRYADALPVALDAVAAADSAWGPDHAGAADARSALGLILMNMGEGDRAVAVLSQVGAQHRTRLGREHPHVFATEIMIGQAYAAGGHFARARTHFDSTLEAVTRSLGAEHPYRAHLLIELAKLELDGGRLASAEALARESLERTTATLGADHRFALWARLVLARVRAARGELAAADSLLRGVLRVQQATLGDDHPETARTLGLLADVDAARARVSRPGSPPPR